MLEVIVTALAPIFLIMLLGFIAGKTKMVDNKNVSILNVFVMDFALPVSLFSAIVKTPWTGIVQESPLILVLAIVMWLVYAFMIFLSQKVFKKGPEDSAVLALTVAFPNFAALGLPVLSSLIGDAAASLPVAVCIATGSILVTPICLLALEQGKAKRAGNNGESTAKMLPILMWRSFKKPIVLGPLFGVILSALNVHLPDIVFTAIKPLGLAATAGALFLTGVILSARKLQLNLVVGIGTVLKLILQPLLCWGIVVLFGFRPEMAATAVMVFALSAGFFGVVFGNRYGVSSPNAEAVLLLSSILCIVTLPMFIQLYYYIFK